jgi:hypothetical protein
MINDALQIVAVFVLFVLLQISPLTATQGVKTALLKANEPLCFNKGIYPLVKLK